MTKPFSLRSLASGRILPGRQDMPIVRATTIDVAPMDETLLAREIAKIMDVRPQCATGKRREAAASIPQWLGEEDDRAFVESYTSTPHFDDDATDAVAEDNSRPLESAGDQAHELGASVNAGTTAHWVRKAKRQKWRSRLRDAAGWAISVTVSIVLVTAVGIAMFGWPAATQKPIDQVRVHTLDMSKLERNAPVTQSIVAVAPEAVIAKEETVEAETATQR